MFKIELVDAGGTVVDFFEVAHDIPLSSLAIKLEVAVKWEKAQSAVCWQVRRTGGRLLFQAKNLPRRIGV